MSDSHVPRSDDQPAEWEPVGRAIKLERTARGWQRKDLAERSGISYPYLSEIESGRKRPSARALRQIADALGIQMSELLQGAESIAPEAGLWQVGRGKLSKSWFHDRAATLTKLGARGGEERAQLAQEISKLMELLPDDDLEQILALARRFARSRGR